MAGVCRCKENVEKNDERKKWLERRNLEAEYLMSKLEEINR
ncbi:hypothetical protein GCM10020331_090470 [Ectobacillus funiculus]